MVDSRVEREGVFFTDRKPEGHRLMLTRGWRVPLYTAYSTTISYPPNLAHTHLPSPPRAVHL